MNIDSRRIGKYEVLNRLGRGGMAEVWKAFDPHLQRNVAIKILHADLQNDLDFVRRFEREARAVASLRHPNIVQIHDFQISQPGENGSSIAYMVMEYIEGTTLTEYIRSTSYQGHFSSADEIIHLFTTISRAIDYAHQRGMIHRDIKPANILLDKRNPSPYQMGEPILTDFGIVKLLGATTATLSGAWMGTPAYISPEQAQGHPGNEGSDIYSLGVILYEICTGVRPFQGDSALAIIWHHINTEPPSPSLINPHIPFPLSQVILHSLAKDPAARFHSASEMARAIAQAFSGQTPHIAIDAINAVDREEHMGSPHPSPAATPSSPAQSKPMYSTPLLPVGSSTPRFSVSQTPVFPTTVVNMQNTPRNSTHHVLEPPPATSIQSPVTAMGAVPALSPPHISMLHGPRRKWLILSLVLLCIMLVSSGVGAFYFLQKSSGSTAVTEQIVGQAVFMSSGQINLSSGQGINDQLQLDLHDIPAPAAGESYYAWLLGAHASTLCPPSTIIQYVFIGKLTVDHGNVHLHYGNPQHDNLLGFVGGLLITEESASITPTTPSLDHSTWRYSAELPQEPGQQSAAQASVLENLRCLLFDQPNLVNQGLHGGLETQFLTNIQLVLNATQEAETAFNNRDTHALRQHVLFALEYIDGFSYFTTELPGQSPPLSGDSNAQVGLIALSGGFADYLNRIYNVLTDILNDPGLTPDMQQHTRQASQALSNIKGYLQTVHDQALQVVHTPDAQLLQPATQDALTAMVMNAQYAYEGHIDTSTSQLGALQIDNDIRSLTTLEIHT